MEGHTGACCDVVRLVDRGEREGTESPEAVGANGRLTAVLGPGVSDAARESECRRCCEGGHKERGDEHYTLKKEEGKDWWIWSD